MARAAIRGAATLRNPEWAAHDAAWRRYELAVKRRDWRAAERAKTAILAAARRCDAIERRK